MFFSSDTGCPWLPTPRHSSDRSVQVQHKSDFDFNRSIFVEIVWIWVQSPSIFEERHLICMPKAFFFENGVI